MLISNRVIPLSLSLLLFLLSQDTRIATANELKIPKSETVLDTDIDGDGKPDRVVASYYIKPVIAPSSSSQNSCQSIPGIFVSYKLTSSKTNRSGVIFEYNYGNSIAQYWTHSLEVGRDINQDGLKDLFFYAGDDTSDEKVMLVQQAQGFKAIYLGSFGHPSIKLADNNHITDWLGKKTLGYWDSQVLTWKGNRTGWIKGDCVMLRTQPNTRASKSLVMFKNSIVTILDDRTNPNWIFVSTESEQKGWVARKYLSQTTNSRWFP